MKELKIEIEEIENGLIVRVDSAKPHYFKNMWGIGKYLQEEIEKILNDGGKLKSA